MTRDVVTTVPGGNGKSRGNPGGGSTAGPARAHAGSGGPERVSPPDAPDASSRDASGRFTVALERPASVEEINNAFREAAESEEMEGILGVSDEPLVSSDYIGTEFSTVVDLELTSQIGNNLVKVVAWYDNEWGYSCRVADLTALVGDALDDGSPA